MSMAAIIMGMTMIETGAHPQPLGEGQVLLPLFAWMSPSYPVGCYAYSHTLEWAVESGDVNE
jgi:urease accessory protein